MIEALLNFFIPEPQPEPHSVDWQQWAAIATVGSLVFAVLAAVIGQLSLLISSGNRRREKQERVNDLHTIIHAHIKTVVFRYGSIDDQRHVFAVLIEQMRNDPEFIPFFIKEPKNELVQPSDYNLMSLPRSTLEPIFLFYDALAEHEVLISETRSKEFLALSPERRTAIIADFQSSYEKLQDTGLQAMEAISVYGGSADPIMKNVSALFPKRVYHGR